MRSGARKSGLRAAPILLVPLAGCVQAAPVPNEAVRRELVSLRARVRAVEARLECQPELRALLRSARSECASLPAARGGAATSLGASSLVSCKSEQLRGAIERAERDLGVRELGSRSLLSWLVERTRHEVVYPSDETPLPAQRERRLQALAGESRLPSTRYLLLTAPLPSTAAAERRVHQVAGRLLAAGVPLVETLLADGAPREQTRFDPPWLFRFDVSPSQLLPVDRPLPSEPSDPERAVHVFRLDCP